jgi:hypothetical protein
MAQFAGFAKAADARILTERQAGGCADRVIARLGEAISC